MSIEAMKQALEALEEIHPGNMTPMAEEAWNKVITALRQAIEQEEDAVAAEREACAKVCEEWLHGDWHNQGVVAAAMIRARGEK